MLLTHTRNRLAIETRDLVIKKMVYLYLTNYAKTHPELAQMCTNTLQKDCGNEDPMVRGLALRALCSLNLPQMVEYISEPLRRSLSDGHAYVRKTGVMGILKLYHLDPEGFEHSGFVDILYDMLRDPDASVVTNCIIVLNEIMQKSPNGGMAINRAIMLHLLNRIHEFNEFAKVQVLELVPRYIPANEDEGFQIMNLLDPVLQTESSGAVMATVQAFLSLADQLGDDSETMKRQIVERIKAPLVTQISSGSSEMMYAILKHVEALAEMCVGSFDDEYRQFYVRYNEPTHVKYLKVQILPKLANPDTAPDIVAELMESAMDTNHLPLSRLAIRSMGQIGCSDRGGPGAAEAIARRLVEMLDSSIDSIPSEAASSLMSMIRKHPDLKPLVAPPLVRTLKYSNDQAGKASLIYLVAECGDIIPEAPYALERLIDSYDEIKEVNVKQALLSSTVKLFFKRAPEVQQMLGRVLAKASDDVSSQDLHDRALFYYRMLSSGADARMIESVVKTNTQVSESMPFSEDDDLQLRTHLMEEFNTLAVIFGKPSISFVAPEYQVKYKKMPEEHPLPPGVDGAPLDVSTGVNPAIPNGHIHSVPSQEEVDLFGFGGSAPAPAAPPSIVGGLNLTPGITISGEEYQGVWESIPDSDSIVNMIPLNSLPSSTDQVENALSSINLNTMASGELPTEFKFFLYAQDSSSGSLILLQANADKSTPQDPMMIVTFKVQGSAPPQQFADQLTEMISRQLN